MKRLSGAFYNFSTYYPLILLSVTLGDTVCKPSQQNAAEVIENYHR